MMNRISFLNLGISLLMLTGICPLTHAQNAGESSSAAAPRFYYSCFEQGRTDDQVQVNIVGAPPLYAPEITILDFIKPLSYSEPSTKSTPSAVGAGTEYVGATLTFKLQYGWAPIIENGNSYIPGQLFQNGVLLYSLKCSDGVNSQN